MDKGKIRSYNPNEWMVREIMMKNVDAEHACTTVSSCIKSKENITKTIKPTENLSHLVGIMHKCISVLREHILSIFPS